MKTKRLIAFLFHFLIKPEQLLKHVRRAVDAFVDEAEQFDDLTMLCLEYKGKQ